MLDFSSNKLKLRRRLRHFYDKSAKIFIAIGGVGVIVAILLIFLYLLYEVLPLFRAASVQEVTAYNLENPNLSDTLHLAIEEQSEIGMRLGSDGEVIFFNTGSGATVARQMLALPTATSISSFALDSEASGIFSLGLSNGEAIIASYSYQTSFSRVDNSRQITPSIEYPYGTDAFEIFQEQAVASLALRTAGDNLILAGKNQQGELKLVRGSKQTNLFAAFDAGSESNIEIESLALQMQAPDAEQLFIDADLRWLYLIANNGLVHVLDIRAAFAGASESFAVETFLTEDGARLTVVEFLLGGISLLVGDESGKLSQWFLVRGDERMSLQKVRSFTTRSAVVALTSEQRRKNFIAVDTDGNVAIYNTTAHREVFQEKLTADVVANIAVSPRGNSLLLETTDGLLRYWDIDNDHPEVSWSALWDRVWYESYPEPEYIWQSSASTNFFEPKYSLVPLSFGTLKAAFYAMLLAAPLAICGAIFTGYFMAPAMRRKVKPLIELMEALPTVVLGFLAGLWLAPFVEKNLLGIFSVLIVLPLSILVASFAWMQLPRRIRDSIPEGWEAGILIPVVLIFGYLSFVVATPLENLFFDGDMRFWITNEMGISYDQRNALVVGFAMGFAVIPTIFSIAEDAIFTVPKQLTYGSLALGATPWQSLYRVVLPTASPGIFSALMIGMGRAVGETMIVLMATGNTPIMDVNIFEGMRTLAANIAVEIPEAEVDSTHYRILFLAALVLFMFTFLLNTVAEIIRQRLRAKYSTI